MRPTFSLSILVVIAFGILAGGMAIAVFLGLIPVDAVSAPPKWEEAIASIPLDHSVDRRARKLHDPIDVTEENLQAGRALFERNCAACHGDGKGTSPWGAKNFYPRVPQFGTEDFDLSAAQAFVVVKYGIRYSGMAAWDGVMTDDDIWRVTTFLSQLSKLPPNVQAQWHPASN